MQVGLRFCSGVAGFAIAGMAAAACVHPQGVMLKQDVYARERCIPVTPVPSQNVTFPDGKTGVTTTTSWAQLTPGAIIESGLLPNQQGLSSTSQIDVNGSVTFAGAGVTAEAGDYTSVLDYSLYRVEPLPNKAGQQYVGVAIRVKADIVTTKAGVNLGSLMAIGAAAQENSASGKMQVYVIGIGSSDVIQLFPTPTTIDQTSIQKTLESVASIKAKIATSTALRPHILEICLNNDPNNKVSVSMVKATLQ